MASRYELARFLENFKTYKKKIPFKKIEKSFTKNLKIALQELGDEGIYLNSWTGNLIMTRLSKELFHNPKNRFRRRNN